MYVAYPVPGQYGAHSVPVQYSMLTLSLVSTLLTLSLVRTLFTLPLASTLLTLSLFSIPCSPCPWSVRYSHCPWSVHRLPCPLSARCLPCPWSVLCSLCPCSVYVAHPVPDGGWDAAVADGVLSEELPLRHLSRIEPDLSNFLWKISLCNICIITWGIDHILFIYMWLGKIYLFSVSKFVFYDANISNSSLFIIIPLPHGTGVFCTPYHGDG